MPRGSLSWATLSVVGGGQTDKVLTFGREGRRLESPTAGQLPHIVALCWTLAH